MKNFLKYLNEAIFDLDDFDDITSISSNTEENTFQKDIDEALYLEKMEEIKNFLDIHKGRQREIREECLYIRVVGDTLSIIFFRDCIYYTNVINLSKIKKLSSKFNIPEIKNLIFDCSPNIRKISRIKIVGNIKDLNISVSDNASYRIPLINIYNCKKIYNSSINIPTPKNKEDYITTLHISADDILQLSINAPFIVFDIDPDKNININKSQIKAIKLLMVYNREKDMQKNSLIKMLIDADFLKVSEDDILDISIFDTNINDATGNINMLNIEYDILTYVLGSSNNNINIDEFAIGCLTPEHLIVGVEFSKVKSTKTENRKFYTLPTKNRKFYTLPKFTNTDYFFSFSDYITFH